MIYIVWKDGHCVEKGLEGMRPGFIKGFLDDDALCGCPDCLWKTHRRLGTVLELIAGKQLPLWKVVDGRYHLEATGRKVLDDFPWKVAEIPFHATA
jgi:hypothetical protein